MEYRQVAEPLSSRASHEGREVPGPLGQRGPVLCGWLWCLALVVGCGDPDSVSGTSSSSDVTSGSASDESSSFMSNSSSLPATTGVSQTGSGSHSADSGRSDVTSDQDSTASSTSGHAVQTTTSASSSTTSIEPTSIDSETSADSSSDAASSGNTVGSTDTATQPDETGSDVSGEQPDGEVIGDALIVAPNGQAGAAGTVEAPTTLEGALGRVQAGGTIYLRAGTYPQSSSIDLSANGSEDAPIRLFAYPLDDERPRFDFSAMSEDSANRGFLLSGDHWHLFGFDTFNAGDNCMFVSGSHNTIEFVTFSECADTGLQLGNGAADNLVLNCDSFFNADSTLENADGFAAKLDVGTGNRFVGCRAWNNLDDGWDGYLRPADGVTTSHENCWAIENGKLKDGSEGAGDGNGFKTGGSDDKDLSHNATYVGCIAAGNVHDGFDHNSNRGSVTIANSAAHANGTNINFSSSNIAASLTVKNTLTVGDEGSLQATATTLTHNSWQGTAATAEDFVSLDINLLKGPRQADGSLPDVDYMKLVPGSDLRNAGIDDGRPYNGAAPDIGAFESDE